MSAYATAAQYRSAVGKTDTAQDADILRDLLAISRYLDYRLGRSFGRDAAATARVYLPRVSGSTLTVDDLAEPPTAVAVDEAGQGTYARALAASDYELLPLNAQFEPEPRPWYALRLVPWGSFGSFTAGQRVRVTAVFGWPAVPPAVERATIQLTAILRLETPRATRRIPELGDAVETSVDAQRILRQLTDRYRVVHYGGS